MPSLSACVVLDFHPEMKQRKKGSQDALETALKSTNRKAHFLTGCNHRYRAREEAHSTEKQKLNASVCFYCLLD